MQYNSWLCLLCHMYFKQNVSAKQSHVKLLQLIIKGPHGCWNFVPNSKHLQVELKKFLFASLNRVFGLEKRDWKWDLDLFWIMHPTTCLGQLSKRETLKTLILIKNFTWREFSDLKSWKQVEWCYPGLEINWWFV